MIVSDLRQTLYTNSAQETYALGQQLGRLLDKGHLIYLSGDLGAGKTTLAQGIGLGWGAEQNLTSPTFVIVRRYGRARDSQSLHHLDLYRLGGADDLDGIGWDDILDQAGAILIEWPQQAEGGLPPDGLWVMLENVGDENPDQRQITLRAGGGRSALLLGALMLALEAEVNSDEVNSDGASDATKES